MTLLKCGLQWQIELFTSAQHISLVFLTLPACVTLATLLPLDYGVPGSSPHK